MKALVISYMDLGWGGDWIPLRGKTTLTLLRDSRTVTLKYLLLQQIVISLDYKKKLMIDFINKNSVIRNCHVCIKMHEKENKFSQHPIGKNSSTARYSLSVPVTVSHPYVYSLKVKDIKLQRANKSKEEPIKRRECKPIIAGGSAISCILSVLLTQRFLDTWGTVLQFRL